MPEAAPRTISSSGPGSVSSSVSRWNGAHFSGTSAAVMRTRFRPVVRRRFVLAQGVGVFVTRRHRRLGAREHLVMLDIQQAQPALLAHGEGDEAAELDQLGLAEVPV